MGRSIEINAFLFKGKSNLFILIFCIRKKARWFLCWSKRAKSVWYKNKERNMMWLQYLECFQERKKKLRIQISHHHQTKNKQNMDKKLEIKSSQNKLESKMNKWIKSDYHNIWLNNLFKLKFIQFTTFSFFISLNILFVSLIKSIFSPFINALSRSFFNIFL